MLRLMNQMGFKVLFINNVITQGERDSAMKIQDEGEGGIKKTQN